MEISINEKTYKVKYGFKALMMYERIVGGAFDPKTLGDILTFFFCCVLAGGAEITYEQFLDALDEDPDLVNEFSLWLKDTVESKQLKKAKGKKESK